MSRPGRAAAWTLALTPLVAVLLVGVRGPAYADERVFRWQDPAITESSGLVVAEDGFVTVNDSGNSAELFVVDPSTGETVERVPWAASQVDVEGLAPGPGGSVWVADIGDNLAARARVTVSRVPLDGGPVATYALRYPDGRARDAETLLAHPGSGRLYVVTKGLVGEVYAAPVRLRRDRPNRLRLVGSAGPALTDGAFWPDGKHVLLRGYGLALLYTFPDLELLGSVELPSQPQGEALAVTPAGEVFVSSEGAGTPVWQVDLPAELLAALAGSPAESSSESPSESPPESAAAAGPAASQPDAATVAGEQAWGRSPAVGLAAGAAGVLLGLVGAMIWWRKGRGR